MGVSLLKDSGNDSKELEPGHTRTYEEIQSGTAATVIEALELDENFEKSHIKVEYNSQTRESTTRIPKRAHNCVNI